jgi:hypothetical protein
MIGRALRGEAAEGTKEAYIVSFIDDWQDKIAWVNAEKLLIDETATFDDNTPETQKQLTRLVAISKIEEFAKIANDTIDGRLSELLFIDRIPIGVYNFKYLLEGEDTDVDRVCDIFVYNSMQSAYDDMFEWLPTADLKDTKAAAEHIDTVLFGCLDLLLGYRKQDIVDIIEYYKQTGIIPQMIYLTERKNYDITVLAKYIFHEDLRRSERREYLEKQWDSGNSHWAVFFGVDKFGAFEKLVDNALYQLERPKSATTVKPITEKEQRQIQDLPLYEIRQKFPELGEKIRDYIFNKFTDSDDYYFSAQSGYKSQNKLDFQIDHIIPMADGGKTVLNNLQLLTRVENMIKSDN